MKFKKARNLVVLGLLTGFILGGCGSSTETLNQTSASEGDGETQTVSEAQTVSEDAASDELIELTIHLGTNDSGVFNDEWPIFLAAQEITNVKLTGSLPSTTTDYDQAFSLMIASGDIPDIVLTSNTNFFTNGADGAFEPLEDLIDQYAPNLKQFLDENPDVRSMATGPDGHIWFIPFVQDGEAQSGWFIRQDWLDKLDLEAPKNVEELHNVLTAFANEDPNGNGLKDEVPYFHRSSVNGINDLLSLWGAYSGFFVKEDGVVQYGPMTENYETAYQNIAQWYAEGLIDQEIFTRGTTARDILLGNDQGGMTHDLFGSTGNYNDSLVDQIEGFLFKPITPPENTEGNIIEPTKRLKARTFGWGMSASNEEKIRTIQYFDFWFTEEGRRLANFGIEGDTYTMVDGEPIFTDKVLHGDVPAVNIIRETGAQSSFGFQQDYAYEIQWTNAIALEGIMEYIENGYIQDQFPAVKYTEEEQKELEKINTKINTYLSETTQQWVLGAKAIDFEGFKAELVNLGVEQLVSINQAAYDRYVEETK